MKSTASNNFSTNLSANLSACMVAGALAMASLGSPQAQETATATPGLTASLTGGKASVFLRYRYEFFEQENLPHASHASTVRLAFGYETAPYLGLSLNGQLAGAAALGTEEYRVAGLPRQDKAGHPVIADPLGSEINNLFVKYTAEPWKTAVKVGRQDVVLNNARFVSNSGWRQKTQTFDAARLDLTPVPNLNLTYAFLAQANRVVGRDAVGGEVEMRSSIANASWTQASIGKASVYGLLLDYPDTVQWGNSSNTFGARAEGPLVLNESLSLLYAGEFAMQSDAGKNPNSVDSRYLLAELGLAYQGLGLKLGYNVRSGSSATDKFTTPLSHPWDGWTELFLNTPDAGLQVFSVSLAGPVKPVPGLTLSTAFYQHSAESRDIDYGSEIDAGLEYRLLPLDKNLVLGARYAYYMADALFANATRASFYSVYAF